MSKYNMHIGIITSIVVFFFTEWIFDRIAMRAHQLSQNTMDAEYESHSIQYAAVITLIYMVLYWVFIKDVFGGKKE